MGLSNYFEAFKLSLTISLLLAYIFMTCKVYHDRTRTKNRLSYVPFGLIIADLTINICGLIETGIN